MDSSLLLPFVGGALELLFTDDVDVGIEAEDILIHHPQRFLESFLESNSNKQNTIPIVKSLQKIKKKKKKKSKKSIKN